MEQKSDQTIELETEVILRVPSVIYFQICIFIINLGTLLNISRLLLEINVFYSYYIKIVVDNFFLRGNIN